MKKCSVLLLAALMLFAVAGCASSTGKLESVQKKGTIVVYTDPNFSPFEFMGNNDEIIGVDMEIAKAIAAELGVKVEFKEEKFESILKNLKGGRGDIAVSGFTITDKRKEIVDFSDPYILSRQYLILPKSSSIAVMEDLAGKNVGVAVGYTGQFIMSDVIAEGGVLEGTNTHLKKCNSAIEGALDIGTGRLDAVVMDEYVAKNITADNDGLKTIPLAYADGSLEEEEYGVAVAKGNEDLLVKINAVIAKLKSENKIEQWVVEFSQ